MKKIKNLKTFHEIFLFFYYIVLFGDQVSFQNWRID